MCGSKRHAIMRDLRFGFRVPFIAVARQVAEHEVRQVARDMGLDALARSRRYAYSTEQKQKSSQQETDTKAAQELLAEGFGLQHVMRMFPNAEIEVRDGQG